jgi:hypothetical protein
MDNIVSDSNLSFIKESIGFIADKLDLNDYKDALWLVYGSYVINMNTSSSDLDIIAIHNSFIKNERIKYTFNEVPIHFTKINMDTIEDDGEKRLYGSYFSGKIINPHIFLFGDEKTKNKALYHAGKFIAPLAGYLSGLTESEFFSASQVTSLVFIAYLSTDPSFDSYFLNYFVSPDFENIWEALCESTIHMLHISDSLAASKNKYLFKKKFQDYKSFHSERMKISARHWSYGAVCHGANYKFQDIIFFKAEEKMKEIDPSGNKYLNMVRFLRNESGLSEIYI